MFVGETVAHFRTTTFTVRSEPLRGQPGAWRNLGFDHIALAVADRQDARRFFGEVIGMQVIREDSHQTVLTTGNSAIFQIGRASCRERVALSEVERTSDKQTGDQPRKT